MLNPRAQILRPCSGCQKTVPPEGGINLSPTRWICVACWQQRQRKNQPKS